MNQPQSDAEIRPVVEALRRLDPLLELHWNPTAVLVTRGYYAGDGTLIPPRYDGRWEVIRFETENFHPERMARHPDGTMQSYAVLCTLTAPQRKDGLLYLVDGGAYAPIGDWVVELMRSADAQNARQFDALRKKIWAQHDALEAAAGRINEGEAREGLDRVHFGANFAGGTGNWQGRGADFATP